MMGLMNQCDIVDMLASPGLAPTEPFDTPPPRSPGVVRAISAGRIRSE
jgi:hypothetical protein